MINYVDMLFNIRAYISLEIDELELKIWRLLNDCLEEQSFPKSDFEFIHTDHTDPETFCKVKSLKERIEVYNNFINILIDLIWMREPKEKELESMNELAEEVLALSGLGAYEECYGYPYFGDAVGFFREICENIPMYWKGRIIGNIRKYQHRHKTSCRI